VDKLLSFPEDEEEPGHEEPLGCGEEEEERQRAPADKGADAGEKLHVPEAQASHSPQQLIAARDEQERCRSSRGAEKRIERAHRRPFEEGEAEARGHKRVGDLVGEDEVLEVDEGQDQKRPGEHEVGERVGDIAAALERLLRHPETVPTVDQAALRPYLAPAIAGRFAEVMEQVAREGLRGLGG